VKIGTFTPVFGLFFKKQAENSEAPSTSSAVEGASPKILNSSNLNLLSANARKKSPFLGCCFPPVFMKTGGKQQRPRF